VRFSTWLAIGLAAGIAAAWLGYPRLVTQTLTQPIRFSHSVHAKQDVACGVCHATAPGGAFSGLPAIEVCAGCHPEPTGARSEDEKEADKLVTQYVKNRKDVPWLCLVREPDHVFFPHGPHLSGASSGAAHPTSAPGSSAMVSFAGCASCHPDMSREDYPELRRNRISGYTNRTMSMDRCRACHADTKATGDCVACHR